MKHFLTTTATLALGICALPAHAHHGSAGQFDASKDITVSGVLTKIRLVNPHGYIYFDVANAKGSTDAWRCELTGGNLLRRNGWTEEMFAVGTPVTITGSAARREEFGCMAKTITLADGRVLGRQEDLNKAVAAPAVATKATLAGGVPNLNGNWVATRRAPGGAPDGFLPGGVRAGGAPGAAAGMAAGGPPGGGRGGPQVAQTEAGIAASAGFKREDNPRYHCQTTNIFMDWVFDEQVNTIVQTKDSITLAYGFMEMPRREIHLNMKSHPAKLVPSRIGHSIGRWDGDALVVDTVGFTAGYLEATFRGVKHSNALHTVERFTLSKDGNTLTRSYVANDPLYLKEPFVGSDTSVRTTDAMRPYDCEDLTEERVKGF